MPGNDEYNEAICNLKENGNVVTSSKPPSFIGDGGFYVLRIIQATI